VNGILPQAVRVDPKFKYEVASMPGGEYIKFCFQCGECVAVCPIRRFTDEFKPLRLIRMAVLGLKELVLPSREIWLCAACYSCTEKCPQGVRPTDVIRAIRYVAARNGYIHPFYRDQSKTIAEYGRIYKSEEPVNKVRERVGLPPLPPVDLEEVRKLMDGTGIKNILEDAENE